MAARTNSDEDKGLRKGRWAPYGLLSPGIIWLLLFFLVPIVLLVRASLSSKASRFVDPEFTWDVSNFSTAFSDYGTEFVRSFVYSGIATVLAVLIGYPLAYWIVTQGGRWRNLLIGLVVVPFFTSYLIRTIAWSAILQDDGPMNSFAQWLPFTGPDFKLMNEGFTVVGGLTYNFISFMILPIYVSLEKIDPGLISAGQDLYSTPRQAFRKIVLPLSLPGVFAGTLLTFIPSAGDYINAELLGNVKTSMIGSQISKLFLKESNYPEAAALSFIFMAIITVGVLIYAKVLGTDELSA